jgi:hypothetical protein
MFRVVYAALAIAVFVRWLGLGLDGATEQPGVTSWTTAPLPRMVEGTANRPYVGRARVPLVVRAVAGPTRGKTIRRWERRILRLGHPHVSRLMEDLAWDEDKLGLYLIGSALALASFFTLPFVVRNLYAVTHPPRHRDAGRHPRPRRPALHLQPGRALLV